MKKKSISNYVLTGIFVVGITISTNSVWAEDMGTAKADDLAKQSQNPVSTLISVPFEMNNTFNNGPEDAYAMSLNIKPVIPVSFSENWNLINRIIAPVIYQDEFNADQGSVFGLGDITYQSFFSPKNVGEFIWGVGPMLIMPTGMDRLTTNQWSLGVNAVGLVMPGPWVIGALVSNAWNVGNGYDDAPNVNMLNAQYFINYNMEAGWYLSSAPSITANWEAKDSDDTWTVPFGGGAGRVFKIGKQNVNMKMAAYYNAIAPDDATDWNLQFTCIFMFPK